MELKFITDMTAEKPHVVLIVPYGIEIILEGVPYCWNDVLIVPYGIEIEIGVVLFIENHVLVVPYGIEIVCEYYRIGSSPFNRTLWSSLKDKCDVCHSCF